MVDAGKLGRGGGKGCAAELKYDESCFAASEQPGIQQWLTARERMLR